MHLYKQQTPFTDGDLGNLSGKHFVADAVLVFACDFSVFERVFGTADFDAAGRPADVQQGKVSIIAADCRLLRTDGFAVTERELDAKNVSRPPVRLSKDADAQPDPSEVRRLSPVNMVYAGGMVESGTALAVAVNVSLPPSAIWW